MQLKSVVENELASAAINAWGNNLLFSSFLASISFSCLLYEMGQNVLVRLTLLFLVFSPWPCSRQGVTHRVGEEGNGHRVMAEPCNVLPWDEADKLNLAGGCISSFLAWRGSTEVNPGSLLVHSYRTGEEKWCLQSSFYFREDYLYPKITILCASHLSFSYSPHFLCLHIFAHLESMRK